MTILQETGPRDAGPLTSLPALGRAVRRIGRGTASAYRRLCYGRMVSVLNRLDDAQLKMIGITRSEIPEYAWRLVRDQD